MLTPLTLPCYVPTVIINCDDLDRDASGPEVTVRNGPHGCTSDRNARHRLTRSYAIVAIDNREFAIMPTLILGLALFHGLHLVPAMPALRARLREMTGPGIYKLVFSLISALALVVIVMGYRDAQGQSHGNVQIWVPPDSLRHITPLLMLPAFILLAAAYIPSRIRTTAQHPMLAAITIWALAHLLVRGDLASVLLFGSFLAFGILDRISVNNREAPGPLGKTTGGLRGDIAAIVVGTMAYAVMVFGLHHGGMFGG